VSKTIYLIDGMDGNQVEHLMDSIRHVKEAKPPFIILATERLPERVKKITGQDIKEMSFTEFIQEILADPETGQVTEVKPVNYLDKPS
jgi:hypothetical protein